MSIFQRKRSLVIAGIVAAGVIGLGSIAYAAFSTTASASAAGSSATMKSLSVDSANTKIDFANGETGLWPDVNGNGDTPGNYWDGKHLATIEVPVTNPNEVGVKISSGDIKGSATFNNLAVQGTCGGFLIVPTSVSLEGGSVSLGAHGQLNDHTTLRVDSVYLSGDAPIDCAGQPFTTSWIITAHAL